MNYINKKKMKKFDMFFQYIYEFNYSPFIFFQSGSQSGRISVILWFTHLLFYLYPNLLALSLALFFLLRIFFLMLLCIVKKLMRLFLVRF